MTFEIPELQERLTFGNPFQEFGVAQDGLPEQKLFTDDPEVNTPYCQNGLGAESRSGQEIRKKSKKVDIYAILGMVLSQNSIPHPQDDTKR